MKNVFWLILGVFAGALFCTSVAWAVTNFTGGTTTEAGKDSVEGVIAFDSTAKQIPCTGIPAGKSIKNIKVTCNSTATAANAVAIGGSLVTYTTGDPLYVGGPNGLWVSRNQANVYGVMNTGDSASCVYSCMY